MAKSHSEKTAISVCPLEIIVCKRLDDRSRMKGDFHVRFCESLRGKFPRATRLVLLCAKDTERPLSMLKYLLERLGLSLNETKTHVVNAWEQGFDFLGFEIRMRRGPHSGKSYPHVQPGKMAVKRIKAKLTELTQRNLTPIPLPAIVQRVNQTLWPV